MEMIELKSKLNEIVDYIDSGESLDHPQFIINIRSFCNTSASIINEPQTVTKHDIIKEIAKTRDRRIDGGFNWNGMRFQSRPSDRENIMGAAQLAMAFIGAGGDPSSLRWANPDSDFEWILEDNGRTTMSAADVVSLLQGGIAFKSSLTFYARDLKDEVLNAEDPLSVDIVNGWPE